MRKTVFWATQKEYGQVIEADKPMQRVSRVWFAEHCGTPSCKVESVGWDQLSPVLLSSCCVLSVFFIFLPSPTGWLGVLTRHPDALNWALLPNVIVLNCWTVWRCVRYFCGRVDVTGELGRRVVASLETKENIPKIWENREIQFCLCLLG